jgi:hypothetical protein
MKKILALLFLTAGCLCAQSQKVDLGSHGSITLYIDDSWKFNISDFGDRAMVSVVPKGDVNANCQLTITYPEQDHFETKNKLRAHVVEVGAPYVEQSVEGRAVAKEFALQTGFGFYCDFTDPKLVGKPPVKDDFKTISVGVIHLAPDVLIEVAISADGFKSDPYQQLLGMVEGMDFAPGGKK